jgi:transcriptional regulator with XRE-family HTH domain
MFGRSLRALREDRGLVAKDVAELLNLNTDTILKYERGEREPSLLTLIRLSHLFGVSVDRLITGQSTKLSMLPFTSLESLRDVVVIRNSDGNVAYVGPDRRRQAAPSKRKGPERRRTGNPNKPGKIKIPKP